MSYLGQADSKERPGGVAETSQRPEGLNPSPVLGSSVLIDLGSRTIPPKEDAFPLFSSSFFLFPSSSFFLFLFY